MKHLLLSVIMLALVGCASQDIKKADAYASANKPLVESGQMKHSDYYKGMYKIISESQEGLNDQAAVMELFDTMIRASLDYEAGKISKDDLDSIKRQVQIAGRKIGEARDAETKNYWRKSFKDYADSVSKRAEQNTRTQQQYKPSNINCTTNGNNTNCQAY